MAPRDLFICSKSQSKTTEKKSLEAYWQVLVHFDADDRVWSLGPKQLVGGLSPVRLTIQNACLRMSWITFMFLGTL